MTQRLVAAAGASRAGPGFLPASAFDSCQEEGSWSFADTEGSKGRVTCSFHQGHSLEFPTATSLPPPQPWASSQGLSELRFVGSHT